MFIKICLLAVMISGSLSLAHGQVEPPKLDPTPSTGQQQLLIREGVVQHDKRNYDAAIARYEEVLAENPNNVEAIYELSFSYAMKKDYRKSLDYAYKGAMYKSDMLPGFYLQIGNNLDELGEPKKSIEVYKAGIKLMPRMALLHYNLGVTYRDMGKLDDAKKAVKRSLTLNPNHPGSHAVLSTLWYATRYKTPSLLATCRFLVLEPRTDRSTTGLQLMKTVLGGGAKRDGSNQITIFIDTAAKKDEGDFTVMDFVLGTGGAMAMSEENKGKTEMRLLTERFERFFGIMSEQQPKADRNSFTWKFYAPYFIELKQKKFVEPFVYYISQADGNEETVKWLAANKARVGDFLAWSKLYKWPEEN